MSCFVKVCSTVLSFGYSVVPAGGHSLDRVESAAFGIVKNGLAIDQGVETDSVRFPIVWTLFMRQPTTMLLKQKGEST